MALFLLYHYCCELFLDYWLYHVLSTKGPPISSSKLDGRGTAKNIYIFIISHVDSCIFHHQVQSQLTSAGCLLCVFVTGAYSDGKRPFKINIFEGAAKICLLTRTLKSTVFEGTIVGIVNPGQSYEPMKDKLRATALWAPFLSIFDTQHYNSLPATKYYCMFLKWTYNFLHRIDECCQSRLLKRRKCPCA